MVQHTQPTNKLTKVNALKLDAVTQDKIIINSDHASDFKSHEFVWKFIVRNSYTKSTTAETFKIVPFNKLNS